jgi:redox-sensitive bicupin YhaK (pirin superfamily)
MDEPRAIRAIYTGRPTLEGAGVRLQRVFGYDEVPSFDPFLMMDDFGSSDPEDYMAGFPWHPHRGIETVTYMLHGEVRHGDSLGNAGAIADGQVQWMTAGSGIIHQEMPQEQPDCLRGIQLWVNLPAKDKMMSPRYRDIRAKDILVMGGAGGSSVKVIAGGYGGGRGPVRDIVSDPLYLDIAVPKGATFVQPVPDDHTTFVYAIDGEGTFDRRQGVLSAGSLGLYGRGTEIEIAAGSTGLRFLLIAGKPIGEPVAWRGPIVMNTEAELDLAFREYRNGTFIKHENRAR